MCCCGQGRTGLKRQAVAPPTAEPKAAVYFQDAGRGPTNYREPEAAFGQDAGGFATTTAQPRDLDLGRFHGQGR